MRDDITGAFGGQGEYVNGRRVLDFCERGFCLGNTYFKHESVRLVFAWIQRKKAENMAERIKRKS